MPLVFAYSNIQICQSWRLLKTQAKKVHRNQNPESFSERKINSKKVGGFFSRQRKKANELVRTAKGK